MAISSTPRNNNQSRERQRLRSALVVIAIMFVAGGMRLPASAQAQQQQDRLWDTHARLAPADTDLFIAVRDSSRVRRGAVGPALEKFITRSLPLTATSGAWASLADGLGISTSDAFDEILGDDAAFIFRRDAERFEWSLVSSVDRRTATRLLYKLGAKPSSIKAGRPVAEIEGGRFRIAARAAGDRSTLIFVPAASDALFRDVLGLLDDRRGDSLQSNAHYQSSSRALPGGGDAFVFVRATLKDKAEATWLGAEFRADGMDILADVATQVSEHPARAARLTAAQWREMSDGAVLAVYEPLDLAPLPIASVLGAARMNITDLLLPIRGSAGLILTNADEKPALCVIIETADTAALARGGDTMIAGLASSVAPPGSDFRTLDGMFPATRRRLDAALRPNPDPFARGLINAGLVNGSLPLIWSYPSDPAPAAENGTPGWLVIATEERLHNRIVRVLTQPAGVRAEAPASHFSAQPAPLLEIARRAGLLRVEPGSPDEPPIFSALGLLEHVAGESFVRDGLVLGRFRLRFSDDR